MIEEKATAQLEYQTHNVQLAIRNRIESYVNVLRSVEALFYSKDHVTRAEFHDYVSELLKQRKLPGIVSINYAQRVSAADKQAFEDSVRHDTSLDPRGYPGFRIRPPGERSEYQVLVYVEPMMTNEASFGLDFASNPRSASAFAKARDDGEPISSGRLIRVRGPRENVALAMRIPVYRRNLPHDTPAQRRLALIGSVGAGFDLTELMQGALDQNMLGNFRIRLYDTGAEDENPVTGTTDPSRLLYETLHGTLPAKAGARSDRFFVKRTSMKMGRRIWELEFTADKSDLLEGFEAYLPPLVLIGGLIGSLLLFSVYYSLTSARRRAVELAADMTKDLRASEASLAEAQRMAHLGSWLLEHESGKMSWSAEIYRILGIEQPPKEPHYHHFLRAVHEDDRRRVRQGIDRAVRTGEQFKTEHRIRLPEGSVHWVQTTAHLSGDEDKLTLRGIMMDITERKQTVDALQRSQELLRELTAYQDRVKEDERKRIAREIHDELGQTLLALRIDVSMLEVRTGNAHPRLNRKVRDALQHLDATVKTIRTIINNLRPAVLDLGLNAAIEWQVNEFRRRSGIACELVMSEQEFALDDARATSLFRILQESLTNVIRHANASQVRIELRQDGGRLVMKIIDNGIGIARDHRETANAFGLVGVEERILALAGTFTIDSAPGAGTTLTIYIPLDAAPSDARRSGT